jgi:hypothetical protein
MAAKSSTTGRPPEQARIARADRIRLTPSLDRTGGRVYVGGNGHCNHVRVPVRDPLRDDIASRHGAALRRRTWFRNWNEQRQVTGRTFALSALGVPSAVVMSLAGCLHPVAVSSTSPGTSRKMPSLEIRGIPERDDRAHRRWVRYDAHVYPETGFPSSDSTTDAAGPDQFCPWLSGAGRTGSSPGSCASSSSCWSPCPSSVAGGDSDGSLVGSSDDVGAGACGVTADPPAGSSAVGDVSASSIPSVVLGRGCDAAVADGLAPALGCRLSRDPTGVRRGDGSTVPSGCRADGCVAGETEPTGRSPLSVSDAAAAVEATTPTDTETTIRRRTNPLRQRRTRAGTPR